MPDPSDVAARLFRRLPRLAPSFAERADITPPLAKPLAGGAAGGPLKVAAEVRNCVAWFDAIGSEPEAGLNNEHLKRQTPSLRT